MIELDMEAPAIDHVLLGVLEHEDVLGAVAVSVDGLVIASAGLPRTDADLVGALGASMVGAAERTARRLGAGHAAEVQIVTTDGVIHICSSDELALVLFSEMQDRQVLSDLGKRAIEDARRALAVTGV